MAFPKPKPPLSRSQRPGLRRIHLSGCRELPRAEAAEVVRGLRGAAERSGSGRGVVGWRPEFVGMLLMVSHATATTATSTTATTTTTTTTATTTTWNSFLLSCTSNLNRLPFTFTSYLSDLYLLGLYLWPFPVGVGHAPPPLPGSIRWGLLFRGGAYNSEQ